MGRTLQGFMNYDSEGYIDFSVAKFRTCHKSEKVNSSTSKKIGISGVTDKYRGNDTVSLRRKTDLYNSAMSGGLVSTQDLIGLLSSTVPAILSGKIQFRFFQKEQILCVKKQRSYRGYVILGNIPRQELLWWIENIRLSNGRKIQQLEPQMTIQTDPSIKGWEQVYLQHEFQTRVR